MDIKIYQIDMERDKNRVAFESLERLEKYQGSEEVDSALYDKVFEGKVDCGNLEQVFEMFNLRHPEGYRGRSLSVSDVVEVIGDAGKSTFHFCDSLGFREIPFDPAKTGALAAETIRVVLMEPGKPPEAVDVENTLEAFQKIVGGPIQAYEPYSENVCFICNRDGKNDGLPLNRIIPEEDKRLEMNYRELVMHFREAERESKCQKHLTGYIVVSQDSFTQPYSEAARTYRVSSDNKAFQPNMGGYSIYASAIDGSDPMVRIEKYLAAEQGGKDGWRIERCYLEQPGEKALDVIAGTFFICGDGDTFTSLSPEQIGRFKERFREPMREQVQQKGAKDKKPSVLAKLHQYSNLQRSAPKAAAPAKRKNHDMQL